MLVHTTIGGREFGIPSSSLPRSKALRKWRCVPPLLEGKSAIFRGHWPPLLAPLYSATASSNGGNAVFLR